MTKKEIARVVKVWQHRLELDSWRITQRYSLPVAKGCEAEIKVSPDYEQASIRIASSHVRWSRQYGNKLLVHELLHIFERTSRHAVEHVGKSGIADPKVYDFAWAWYEHGAENWIDRLAEILVKLAGPA